MFTFLVGCLVGAGMVIVWKEISTLMHMAHQKKHIMEDFFKECDSDGCLSHDEQT